MKLKYIYGECLVASIFTLTYNQVDKHKSDGTTLYEQSELGILVKLILSGTELSNLIGACDAF